VPVYRLTLAYEGSDFCGWQSQHNGTSVQSVLEDALSRLFAQPIRCRAAGRTDAGVHALGQVVSFHSDRSLPERALVHGTNHFLPKAVVVLAAAAAADDFDARFSASGKLYRYQIWNAPVRSPLHQRTHWHIMQPLDVARMQQAAERLIGRHDFRAFRAADCERKTTVRLMRRLDVLTPPQPAPMPFSELGPSVIHIEVSATAFLKNMVRILVGTLAQVGRGRMSVEHVASLLQSGDRTQAGPTAPAHGLTLVAVDYGPRTGV
jgi:tRNA pseudouridine38-40 synthase